MRLRTWLALLVVAALAPVGGLAAFLAHASIGERRAEAVRRLDQDAEALARRFDREFSATVQALLALSLSRNIDAEDFAALRSQAEAARAQNAAWFGVTYTRRDGRQVVNTATPPGTALPTVLHPLTAAVLADGRPWVGRIQREAETGRLLVPVTVPVMRGGEAIGVLGVGIEPATLRRLLDDGTPAGRTSALVDDEGRFVAHNTVPEGDRTGAAAPAEVAGFLAEARPSALLSVRRVTGEGAVAAARRLELAPWAAVVGAPQAALEAELREPLTRTAGLFVSATGLAVALAFGLATLVTRRMRMLAASAASAETTGRVPAGSTGVAEMDAVLASLRATTDAGLRARDAELDRTQRLALVGSYEIDFGGGGMRNYRSPAYLRIHGLPPDAQRESHEAWVARLHPDDRERAERAFLQTVAGDAVEYTNEYRIRRADDGATRWISVLAEIQRDARGRPLRLVGAHIDVTERKNAEQELARREARSRFLSELRSRFDETDDPAALFDIACRELERFLGVASASVHEIDEDAGRVTVHTPDPRSGLSPGVHRLDEVYAEPTRARLRSGAVVAIGDVRADPLTASRAEAFEARGQRACLAVPLRRDGRWVGALVLAQPTPRDWGADVSLAQTVAERAWLVQENARLVHDLRRLAADLERRVREKTDEARTHLERVFELQKMETIGQLTGGVAHDFNNLLAAVLSNLELLRKRTTDARALKLLDAAVQGAERGASLTRRLLAFARRQELAARPVALPDLVDGMRDLLARSLGPAVRIVVDLPPDLPRVRVDPNQLELALLNLAVNARDAMPGGGALTIAAAETQAVDGDGLAPGPYVRLSVRDTGSGMDETVLKRATEPFFTTKGVGKGTGLGLSMVEGLAAQSGGALRVTSAPGAGTTIDIWLPRAADGMDEAAPMRPAPRPETASPAAGLTVLVVDDDALVCMGTAAMLEDLGHRTLEAGSGGEALDLLAGHPEIALVLTDQAMPGMTGTELARRLRRERPELPIVLATGYAELPDADADLPRISKPFRQAELAAVVARVTSAEASAKSAAS